VLVEDVSLTFTAMVSLPGPFIKWFEEPGIETLCRMLDGYSDRRATARTLYGLYDGKSLKTFEGVMTGTIADKARGNRGFGFDPVFINDGQLLTRAEMDEATYADTSYRKQAVEKLKQYLHVRD
jgi:XTP/dITP diphosphohydrolase